MGESERAADSDKMKAFQRKAIRYLVLIITPSMVLYAIYLLAAGEGMARAMVPFAVGALSLVALWMQKKSQHKVASHLLFGVLVVGFTVGMLRTPESFAPASSGICLVVISSGFIVGRRMYQISSAVGLSLIFVVNYILWTKGHPNLVVTVFFEMTMTLIAIGTARYLLKNALDIRDALKERIDNLEEVVPLLSDSGNRVSSAAQEIVSLADEHRRGALRQSEAVEQTRKALYENRSLAQSITVSAASVLQNARSTLSSNNEVVTTVQALSEQTSHIEEIVEQVKTIARKSEVLALNASIEGTKAGQEGRGFSLVGQRMQSLAEAVSSAAGDIRDVMDEIHGAATMAKDGVLKTTDLAQKTTETAKEISRAVTKQEASNEQFFQSMGDIAGISKDVTENNKKTLESARELQKVAQAIPQTIVKLRGAR